MGLEAGAPRARDVGLHIVEKGELRREHVVRPAEWGSFVQDAMAAATRRG